MGNAVYPVFVNKKNNKKLAFYPVKKMQTPLLSYFLLAI